MRKVYAGLFMSLDGVVQAPDKWQPGFDEEMGAALGEMLDGQDAMLMGRRTYEEWSAYWPTSTDEPFATFINTTQKYVASSTLQSVDWQNTELITSPVAEFVQKLKEQPGGTIGVGGSPSLVRSLLEAQVLDELTLMVSPVVVGAGQDRLFPEDAAPLSLELVGATATSSGHVIVKYAKSAGGPE